MGTEVYLLGVWATGATIGAAITAFLSGTEDNTDLPERHEDTISMRIGMSIAWPLILAVFTIYAPFYVIYKLGQLYGRRL
jgi:hypothetical protein